MTGFLVFRFGFGFLGSFPDPLEAVAVLVDAGCGAPRVFVAAVGLWSVIGVGLSYVKCEHLGLEKAAVQSLPIKSNSHRCNRGHSLH